MKWNVHKVRQLFMLLIATMAFGTFSRPTLLPPVQTSETPTTKGVSTAPSCMSPELTPTKENPNVLLFVSCDDFLE